jgi:hypothetical protein
MGAGQDTPPPRWNGYCPLMWVPGDYFSYVIAGIVS